MKPRQQPDAGEALQIPEGLLESAVRQEFHHTVLGMVLVRLMQRLKLHLLRRAQVPDGSDPEWLGFGRGCLKGFHALQNDSAARQRTRAS